MKNYLKYVLFFLSFFAVIDANGVKPISSIGTDVEHSELVLNDDTKKRSKRTTSWLTRVKSKFVQILPKKEVVDDEKMSKVDRLLFRWVGAVVGSFVSFIMMYVGFLVGSFSEDDYFLFIVVFFLFLYLVLAIVSFIYFIYWLIEVLDNN